MHRLLFLLVFGAFCLCGNTQILSPYTFSHYGMANGLVSNEINSIVQDRTGYLWIASSNGLQRFDGVHYKTFQHREDDATSLPVNNLEQLLVDDEDRLWVLSSNGQVGLFDKHKFTYQHIPAAIARPSSAWSLKLLRKDAAGNIYYILQEAELFIFDKNKSMFVAASSRFPLLPEWKITDMIQQPGTGKYWFSLSSGGFAIYNSKTRNISYPGNNVEKELAVDSLKQFHRMAHLLFDGKGRLWTMSWDAGSYPHAIVFDPGSKGQKLRTFEFLSTLKTYHEVHGFLEQKDGSIWIHGARLFARYSETEKRFDLLPSDARSGLGVVYDIVSNLIEDREKNIWLSTINYGIYRFNPSLQYFKNVAHLNPVTKKQGSGSLLSFLELKNGDILAGAWGDGLYRYTRDMKEIPLNIKDEGKKGGFSVWNMIYSADSSLIWMACQPGIYRYDVAKGTRTFINPPQLQNRTVRQIAEDKQGNLWLGMHNFGLFKWYAPKSGKDSLVKIPEAGNHLVTKVVTDKKGYVWVALERKGIYAFETETGQVRFHWTNRTPEDSTKIVEGFSDLLLFDDSSVIFSTATQLYRINRNTDKLERIQLPSTLLGQIASLQKDNDGFLWISTSNGLYRYHLQRRILVFFNRQDGMANDHFITAASYKGRDGRLFFGVDDAFIHFYPGQVRFTPKEQKVILTGIQIGKKDISIDSIMKLDLLTLRPGNNSLNVQFSALSYAGSPIIQYKLESIDTEWQTAEKDYKANFPFLPPGKHLLLLRTVNAEGFSSEPTTLRIFVQSPFYQTWWFYTLLAVLAAFVLVWLDKQRMNRKAALQKVRTDIADGLHQDVNTALNNINILSEIARLKSEREPQKAREYLEQIHNKSHNMIIALDDMLWSLDPGNDAMDKTINRMKEFADALMQRTGAVIELLIDKKVERLQLNMKIRHEAFLLFKEGLRSLIDAGTKNCIVHLTTDKGKLHFTIEFENEHCNMQKLNNLLQRRDMEERLESLHAKLDVQVHKSKSVFLLQMPL